MLETIVAKIKQARVEYWENDDAVLSDSEYDQLLIQLEGINPNHELLTKIESKPIDPTLKVKHPTQLLSLDKVYSTSDMFAWMKKVSRTINEKFVITPKYDGLACRWYSDKGILATRGEGGIEGENITSKLPLIKVETPSAVSSIQALNQNMAGELLCKSSDFNNCTVTRSNGKRYSTERNLAAGVINNKDISKFIGTVNLTFIDYNMYKVIRTADGLSSELESIIDFMLELGFPTDGIVISLEDELYANSLGSTSHHPKHSVALKFPDETAEAELLSVTFQVGKSKITPVAEIATTLLDGVNIKRITMHNVKFCIDNDIQIGDTLVIKRAGRVIPNIVKSIPGTSRTSININSCPACNGPIVYEEPVLRCTSKDCSGSILKKLEYAAKILGLNILGPGTIKKCVESYGCVSIVDLITLEYEDFIELDGFAETSASNASNAILKLVTDPIPDYKVFASIGTPGLGSTIWKKILVDYSADELLGMSDWELESLQNVGPERSKLITSTIHDEDTFATLNALFEMFDVIPTKGTVAESKTICFSGKFPFPKKHYSDLALSKGYETVSSVTRTLSLLVNNGAMTAKVSKAKGYGVKVVTLEDFQNDQ